MKINIFKSIVIIILTIFLGYGIALSANIVRVTSIGNWPFVEVNFDTLSSSNTNTSSSYLGSYYNKHACQIYKTGDTTSVVGLQLSFDGSNFYNVPSSFSIYSNSTSKDSHYFAINGPSKYMRLFSGTGIDATNTIIGNCVSTH